MTLSAVYLLLASTPALSADVLLISDPSGTLDELQAELINQGVFGAVDVWAAGASGPMLADLQAYSGAIST